MIWEVGIISGFDLKYHVIEVEADSMEQAEKKAYEIMGANFENRVTHVRGLIKEK